MQMRTVLVQRFQSLHSPREVPVYTFTASPKIITSGDLPSTWPYPRRLAAKAHPSPGPHRPKATTATQRAPQAGWLRRCQAPGPTLGAATLRPAMAALGSVYLGKPPVANCPTHSHKNQGRTSGMNSHTHSHRNQGRKFAMNSHTHTPKFAPREFLNKVTGRVRLSNCKR